MGINSFSPGGLLGAWPGKYVIGLTGNIATGKSVVRRMLEHLGAFGIDADALGHRAIAKDAPGYQAVLDVFGRWILNAEGEVDRSKLSRIVFSDSQALIQLEQIVHPLVKQAVDILIKNAKQKVVVIEAIKLIESGFGNMCDNIWVTYAPQDVQLSRLMNKRGMPEMAALMRITSQPPQEAKMSMVNVVIRCDKSFEDTWQQVKSAWMDIFKGQYDIVSDVSISISDNYTIQRARPEEAKDIASFITRLSEGKRHVSYEDVMLGFGQKAYYLIKRSDVIRGVIGWQVENLVTRIDELYLETTIPIRKMVEKVIAQIENSSQELLCEVALLFLPPELALITDLWERLGYQICSIQSLGVRAWQEAAIDSMPAGSIIRYKKLRENLVLRPV